MKLEEALPLLRAGSKVKCSNQSGYYLIVKKIFFNIDLGKAIYRVSEENGTSDVFSWGIDGHSLLLDDWEVYDSDDQPETKPIESVLLKAINQTVFNFFMDNTKIFTAAHALFPPLSEPLAKKVIETLKHFFDELKVIE